MTYLLSFLKVCLTEAAKTVASGTERYFGGKGLSGYKRQTGEGCPSGSHIFSVTLFERALLTMEHVHLILIAVD